MSERCLAQKKSPGHARPHELLSESKRILDCRRWSVASAPASPRTNEAASASDGEESVIFALVAWLPLLILSAVQAVLLKNVKIPFFYDHPAVYSRFLLAVPLRIVAEIVIGPRIVPAASQFITSGLVLEDHYPDFDAAIADGLRLRDSTLAEVIILAMKGINPADESFLSTPDNTSLANYSRDSELVDQSRVFPFEPRTVVAPALAGLIPMVPLLATVMAMEEIFKLLLKVLG